MRPLTRPLLFALACLVLVALTASCKPRTPPELRTPTLATLPQIPQPYPEELLRLTQAPTPALIISTGLHGYTEPCGCTEDILQGGIDRIAGTAQYLEEHLPDTLFVSAGDALFRFPRTPEEAQAQDVSRLELIASGLQASKLAVLGIGPRDLSRGLQTYLDFVEQSGAEAVSTNLRSKEESQALPPFVIRTLGEQKIAFLNLVDSTALEESPALDTLEWMPLHTALHHALSEKPVQKADLRVLFFHGPRENAYELFQDEHPVDFIIFGTSTNASDEVLHYGSAAALQTWSQGRELGVLRLHSPTAEGRWENARVLSGDQAKQLKELIDVVEGQIASIKERSGDGEAPPILARLEERRNNYLEELTSADPSAELTFSDQGRQFAWDTLALSPSMPEAPAVREQRQAFNRALQEINLASASPPVPAPEGHPSFVGGTTCQSCHSDAHAHWKSSSHASAYATLVERDKQFDLECVGCHVTGYQQPGGSTLGFSKGLENVQCESCHGPGSLHASAPTNHPPAFDIHHGNAEATCIRCHTPEHSPRFDFDDYYARILGPGHGQNQ